MKHETMLDWLAVLVALVSVGGAGFCVILAGEAWPFAAAMVASIAVMTLAGRWAILRLYQKGGELEC